MKTLLSLFILAVSSFALSYITCPLCCVFLGLPAAVSPYPRGNHLTLTLSGDHIDFLVGVIAIKTPA